MSLCSSTDWSLSRAVLFLDPYGMQVDWSTVSTVAHTRAIDLWHLVPVGIGVNRMLPKSGNVPVEWAARSDRCFGNKEWREVFYQQSGQSSFFDDQRNAVIKDAGNPKIKDYFLSRLKSVFPGVSDDVLPLYNSTNSLMYVLCFACGNPHGKTLALRIAKYVLRQGR